ncbi:uncharacterized protein LOC143100348 isoform X2 [Alosa pseudoharengus]|uniref:uncharacterized protein LOC143100348 isoform X2 n=1 Tax=Alosa pseudoharengus TaxID=34774 RepID=UPI003F89D1B7
MATSECIMVSLLIFTSVASLSVSAGDIFGLRGGSISLSPEQVTKDKTVMSIIWKHNKDKVAEWLKGDEGITVFSIFNCSATVDNQTWVLTISNLQPHFNGTYSVEINNKENDLRMQLTVLDPVKEPDITTYCNSTSCTLTCEGEDNSEHTQFSWTDRKGNRNSGNMWTVEKRSEVYICNFSNPVSWAIRSFSLTDDLPLGIIAGIVLAIVGGIAVVILIVRKIHRCRKNRTGMYTPGTAELSGEVAGLSCNRTENEKPPQPENSSSIMNGDVVVNVQNGSAPQETPNLTEAIIKEPKLDTSKRKEVEIGQPPIYD